LFVRCRNGGCYEAIKVADNDWGFVPGQSEITNYSTPGSMATMIFNPCHAAGAAWRKTPCYVKLFFG
jgi:hypothetical protein